jgi:Flp pilus assembly protein TadG
VTRTGRGDRGQSTVELALVLPLVALLLLLVLQGGLIVRDDLLLSHAAREAARSAAVAEGDRRAAATEAARRSSSLSADHLGVQVTTAGRDERVAVHVTYRSTTEVPLIGLLLPDIDLSADATMRLEADDDG